MVEELYCFNSTILFVALTAGINLIIIIASPVPAEMELDLRKCSCKSSCYQNLTIGGQERLFNPSLIYDNSSCCSN